MERLGRVLKRLGAENASWKLSAIMSPPWSQLRLAPENLQFLMKKVTFGKTTYRETTEDLCRDRVPLNADTQLGAFGPGADPTRSRAAYPPPRLAVNPFTFCFGRLGSLDWASWKTATQPTSIINPRSFQNPSKNAPKSTQNRSKIHPKTLQNRGLEGILLRIAFGTPFSCVLGASWAVLRASWGRLGSSWARLGPFWGHLGGVLGRLGGVLGVPWGVLGAAWGLLVASWGVFGSQKKATRLGPYFRIDFCSIFVPT